MGSERGTGSAVEPRDSRLAKATGQAGTRRVGSPFQESRCDPWITAETFSLSSPTAALPLHDIPQTRERSGREKPSRRELLSSKRGGWVRKFSVSAARSLGMLAL